MHIYVTLLKQMAPEHLLATFAKLCAEILAAASDGMLNIEDVTGQSVLQVTLFSQLSVHNLNQMNHVKESCFNYLSRTHSKSLHVKRFGSLLHADQLLKELK